MTQSQTQNRRILLASRPIDALFTAGPVFMNILIGVVQEARAKHQLDGIALARKFSAVWRSC